MLARKKKSASINLILKPEKEIGFSERLLSWVLNYGRYILIITQMVVLSVFFLRFQLDRENAELKERTAEKQAIIDSIGDLENEIRKIQNRLANIRITLEKQDLPLKILNFIEEKFPSNISLSNLSISYEKITFSARAENLFSFNYLLKQLQGDKKFSEVILDDIKRHPDGKVEFKITAKLNQSPSI